MYGVVNEKSTPGWGCQYYLCAGKYILFPWYRSRRRHRCDACVIILNSITTAYSRTVLLNTFSYANFRLVRIHQRLQKAVSCLEFFTTHEWNFKNTNVQRLFTELDPNDQKTFYFDVSQLEWRSYIESYIWGTRRFVLKDDPSTVPSAKKRLKR